MPATQTIMSSVGVTTFEIADLDAAIDALSRVERDSTACAVAMLTGCESMGTATRAALDCADIASAACRVLLRGAASDASVVRAIVEAAIVASDRCITECQNSPHTHCQIHVKSARQASSACQALLSTMPAAR